MTGSSQHPQTPSQLSTMFSLIIPAYNRGSLIADTLRSALDQSVPFNEIIVVDDGSTDNTSEVVQQYADRVIYIRTDNQGVQRARNTGVAHAKSERVAFCDSDDLLDHDYVKVVGAWLADHPETDLTYVNFSTFGARPFFADKFFAAPAGYFVGVRFEQGFYVDDPDLYIKSIRYPCMWVTGMTVRKSFYEAIGGFDPNFHRVITEDWEFNLRAVSQGRVALCRRVLARVRYHTGSQSDNAVRTQLGAVKVLQYALVKHSGVNRYAAEITETMERHSAQAFNAAFAEGNFELAKHALKSPHLAINDKRFLWKLRIIRMPSYFRRLLWQLSQIKFCRFNKVKNCFLLGGNRLN
jgi:glycosyltransferase involved in cell wall biosynthesis